MKHGFILVALFVCGLLTAHVRAQHQGQKVSLTDISYKVKAYKNKLLHMEGSYQGISPSDCEIPDVFATEPITRSDWFFHSDGLCIRVTGGKPANLDQLESWGMPMVLKARLRVVKGRAWLEYESGVITQEPE